MNTYNNQRQESVDFITVLLFIVLIIIGFISISSSTSDINWDHFKLSALATKQIFFLAGAFVIILTILFSNVAVIDYFAYGFYGLALLLNVLVVLVGHEVKGAKSWFGIGGFGLQPSEFAKVATALAPWLFF
jgi:rod shape determining protein RodA